MLFILNSVDIKLNLTNESLRQVFSDVETFDYNDEIPLWKTRQLNEEANDVAQYLRILFGNILTLDQLLELLYDALKMFQVSILDENLSNFDIFVIHAWPRQLILNVNQILKRWEIDAAVVAYLFKVLTQALVLILQNLVLNFTEWLSLVLLLRHILDLVLFFGA